MVWGIIFTTTSHQARFVSDHDNLWNVVWQQFNEVGLNASLPPFSDQDSWNRFSLNCAGPVCRLFFFYFPFSKERCAWQLRVNKYNFKANLWWGQISSACANLKASSGWSSGGLGSREGRLILLSRERYYRESGLAGETELLPPAFRRNIPLEQRLLDSPKLVQFHSQPFRWW